MLTRRGAAWPLLTLVLMASLPASGAELQGTWGGDGIRLDLDAALGRVSMACASGSIRGPLVPDAQGHFEAAGVFETHGGGPQLADAGPGPAARYVGDLVGSTLKLSIQPANGPALQFELRAGVVPKFVRCL